jgi:chaperonin GroES
VSVTVRPRGRRILVRRDAKEGMTAGGIILPDGAKDKPQRGTVVAVGPGELSDEGYRIPVEGLCVGDKVIWQKFAGEAFVLDGKDEIFLVEDKEVLAVLHYDDDDDLAAELVGARIEDLYAPA